MPGNGGVARASWDGPGQRAEEDASPNAEEVFVQALTSPALGRGGRTGPANAAQGQGPEAPRSPRKRLS